MSIDASQDEARAARAALLKRDLWSALSEVSPAITVQVQGETVTLRMDRWTAERLAEAIKP